MKRGLDKMRKGLKNVLGSAALVATLLGCENSNLEGNAQLYAHDREPSGRKYITRAGWVEDEFSSKLKEFDVKEITGVVIKQRDLYPNRSGLDRFLFGDPSPICTEAWLRTEEGEEIYLRTRRGLGASYDSIGKTITIRYRMPEELTRLDQSNIVRKEELENDK